MSNSENKETSLKDIKLQTIEKINWIEVNELLFIIRDLVLNPRNKFNLEDIYQALEECIKLVFKEDSFNDAMLLLGAEYESQYASTFDDEKSTKCECEHLFKNFRIALLNLYKWLQVKLVDSLAGISSKEKCFFTKQFIDDLGNKFKSLILKFPCPAIYEESHYLDLLHSLNSSSIGKVDKE